MAVGSAIYSERANAICINYANSILVIYDRNKMLKYYTQSNLPTS